MLGDPKPNVRRPADEGRVGKARIERRERIEARWSGEEGGLVADEHVSVVGEGGERRGALSRRRREPVGGRAVAGLERRREYRAIAGASAEIAGELVTEPAVGLRRARMVGGEQAHHDPGRAEAALRGMVVDHRLLQRMQLAARGEVFNRDELCAVELAQKQNAGVERLVGEPAALELRQRHGACAAIALGAAFLGPLRSHLLAQPVENGRARGESVERNLAAAEKKAQGVARARRSWP